MLRASPDLRILGFNAALALVCGEAGCGKTYDHGSLLGTVWGMSRRIVGLSRSERKQAA